MAGFVLGYELQINSDNRVPSAWRELVGSKTTMHASLAISDNLYDSDACWL